MFRDLLLYGIAAFSFFFGLWFIMVGSFTADDNRGSPPIRVAFDSNPFIHSLITGGLWTISSGIIFLLQPKMFALILGCIPFLSGLILQSGAPDLRIPLLIVALIYSAIAYGVRSYFRSQTNLDVDLPPEVIEEWENQKINGQP